MKRLSLVLAAAGAALLFILFPATILTQEKSPSWEVYFSPHGGCTDAILKELDKAKTAILVQAYSFTSAPIAKGLLNAQKKKVKVEVILDKGQRKEKYSSADFLTNSRISTQIDTRHTIAHNKIIIIDGETVITGSFNFTKAAEERNAENLLVIRDKKLASLYVRNWQEHSQHSESYDGRGRQSRNLTTIH